MAAKNMRVNVALDEDLALAETAAEREQTLDRAKTLTHRAVLRRVPKSKRR